MSLFEVSASYIRSDAPDFLDMYRLEDDKYGIKISDDDAGSGKVKISWSPVMYNDYEMADGQFTEVTSGILYKLYLGYDEHSIQMFASLCQLEAAEQSDKEKRGGGRRLVANSGRRSTATPVGRHPSSVQSPSRSGSLPSGVTVFSAAAPEVYVDAKEDSLKGLKYAVVMAHIFREGEEPVSLAYPPVTFDNQVLSHSNSGTLSSTKSFIYFAGLLFLAIFFMASWCLFSSWRTNR